MVFIVICMHLSSLIMVMRLLMAAVVVSAPRKTQRGELPSATHFTIERKGQSSHLSSDKQLLCTRHI